jgi:hypothetical protein
MAAHSSRGAHSHAKLGECEIRGWVSHTPLHQRPEVDAFDLMCTDQRSPAASSHSWSLPRPRLVPSLLQQHPACVHPFTAPDGPHGCTPHPRNSQKARRLGTGQHAPTHKTATRFDVVVVSESTVSDCGCIAATCTCTALRHPSPLAATPGWLDTRRWRGARTHCMQDRGRRVCCQPIHCTRLYNANTLDDAYDAHIKHTPPHPAAMQDAHGSPSPPPTPHATRVGQLASEGGTGKAGACVTAPRHLHEHEDTPYDTCTACNDVHATTHHATPHDGACMAAGRRHSSKYCCCPCRCRRRDIASAPQLQRTTMSLFSATLTLQWSRAGDHTAAQSQARRGLARCAPASHHPAPRMLSMT